MEVALNPEGVELLPLVPAIPDFQVVPCDRDSLGIQLLTVLKVLKDKGKVTINPVSWWQRFSPSQEELDRRKSIATIQKALNHHQYRRITEGNRTQVLAIVERIFGWLDAEPNGVHFRDLTQEQIFNCLETFHEYSAFFNDLNYGNFERVTTHLIYFISIAPEVLQRHSSAPITFVALNVLNKMIMSFRQVISNDLENRLVNVYENAIVCSDNKFVKSTSYDGLAILNRGLFWSQIKVSYKVIRRFLFETPTGKVLCDAVIVGGLVIPLLK